VAVFLVSLHERTGEAVSNLVTDEAREDAVSNPEGAIDSQFLRRRFQARHFRFISATILCQDELDGLLVKAGKTCRCTSTTVPYRRRRSAVLQDMWSSDKSAITMRNCSIALISLPRFSKAAAAKAQQQHHQVLLGSMPKSKARTS
jgi:hypothetical protein